VGGSGVGVGGAAFAQAAINDPVVSKATAIHIHRIAFPFMVILSFTHLIEKSVKSGTTEARISSRRSPI
jgi:hypothetical protein